MGRLPIEEKTRQLTLAEIHGSVKAMGEMASDPTVSRSFRLRAMEMLLRVGTTDHRARRDAITQLSRAVPFLEQLITQQRTARTKSRVRRLARQIAALSRD